MNNCLRTYGRSLSNNCSRLRSLRKDGQRVATLSVCFRSQDPLPSISELKGPENAEVSREVWLAVRQWLDLYDLSQATPKPLDFDSAPLDRGTWFALWRPYWLAKRRFPRWLPLAPSRRALQAL